MRRAASREGYRLYLPQEWAEDRPRRDRAGVPKGMTFRTKGQIAREQIEGALAAGVGGGIVLADAAYGDEAEFRDWLRGRSLDYVLAVRASSAVWWGKHPPARPRPATRGRPRVRPARDARHPPLTVLDLARAAAEEPA